MKIVINGLQKTFRSRGERVQAVDNVSLEIADGEFLAILGPSGSGKTTLLRCIAGLERADDGEIQIDDRVVFSRRRNVWVAPERRGLSMVFQSYALWPHMTVFDNVAYPLRAARTPSKSIRPRVMRALEMVGCGNLERRHPAQLSGGQQQRIAVARAIVRDSRAVLFDEPLSSVDARVREELRLELLSLQRELGFTSVYITHDQTEATVLGDRVAIMAEGRVIQIGTPQETYAKPNSMFVARFIGAANTLRGSMEREPSGSLQVRTQIGPVHSSQELSGVGSGQEAMVVFRPEHCQLSATPPPSDLNLWRCKIERSMFLGFCTEYLTRINDVSVSVKAIQAVGISEGSEAWLSIDPKDVLLLASS